MSRIQQSREKEAHQKSPSPAQQSEPQIADDFQISEEAEIQFDLENPAPQSEQNKYLLAEQEENPEEEGARDKQTSKIENLFNLEEERDKYLAERINKMHKSKVSHIQEFQTQERDEIIFVRQAPPRTQALTKTQSNWVYIYNLPYEIKYIALFQRSGKQETPSDSSPPLIFFFPPTSNRQEFCKSFKLYIESVMGPVKSMELYCYKDFFEVFNKKRKLSREQEEEEQ